MKYIYDNYFKKLSKKLERYFIMHEPEVVSSEQKTLECRVCHEKIKKGDLYIETPGVDGYVCFRCESIALEEAIYERPIASIDDEK
jgi:hypothetical protein